MENIGVRATLIHGLRARLTALLCVSVLSVLIPLVLGGSALGAGGWNTVGSLASARASFPAVTLPSGKVFVASGTTAELFDPVAKTFSPAGTLVADQGSGLTATLLQNGKVLLAGGEGGPAVTATASAELYDPATGTFTATGSMTVPRAFQTATLLPSGRVLITGGFQFNFYNSGLSTAEIYDPATGSFTATGSMSVARTSHTATLLSNGTVLVTGGYGFNSAALSSAETYDPSTGVFTPAGSMTDPRGDQTATLLASGKVLVAGGHTFAPGPSVASADLYDPTARTFTPTGSMTVARGAQTATLLTNGTVLVAGGFPAFPFTGGPTLSSAEIYSPGSGTFTATASMNVPRGRHAAALLANGDVLVAGGINACCSLLSNAEVFTLAGDTTPPTTPTNLAIPSKGQTTIVLTWNASTDPDDAALIYDIYVNDKKVGDTGSLRFEINGLHCGTAYVVGVGARDKAGNVSPGRVAKSVTTLACG
jgi:hypothetical protein